MTCPHEHVQGWRTIDGEIVPLWSCVKCKRKFAPLERDTDADKWCELMTVLNSPELRPLVVSFKAMIDCELKTPNADITGR